MEDIEKMRQLRSKSRALHTNVLQATAELKFKVQTFSVCSSKLKRFFASEILEKGAFKRK